jgi:hypothetical protein
VHARALERGGSGTVAAVVAAAMTRREAMHLGTMRLSAPHWKGGCTETPGGGKACATWQKGRAGTHGWSSYTAQGG